MQQILARALPALKVEGGSIILPGQQNATQLVNVPKLREALLLLRNVPGVAQISEQLLANHITTAAGPITVGAGEAQQLGQQVTQFAQLVAALKAALDASLPPQDPLAADLRLPHFNNVEALARFLGDIDRVFHVSMEIAPRPSEEKEPTGEPFRLAGFDVGSEWLELVAVATFILTFFSRFWREAARIAGFRQTLATITNYNRVLKISADHAKAAEESFQELLKVMTSESIKTLRGEAPALEPEAQQRAVHALTICADAIERGARLVLASNAPEEAARALPSLAEQDQLVAPPPIAALPETAEPPKA